MDRRAEKVAELRKAIAAMERVPAGKLESSERCEKGEDAFSRIVQLSSFRDRTCSEIRTRLSEEGFEADEIEVAIDRATSCGLVDDMRFADSRIRSLVRKGKGEKCIVSDLKGFGIDVCDVPGWPATYLELGRMGEYDRALALLDRKPSRSKDPFRGAYQKLVRNGYSTEVSFRAAKHWAGEQE